MSDKSTDSDRWYWLAVTLLLAGGLLLWPPALGLVNVLCAARAAQLALGARSLNAFPVQVNVAFLALIVASSVVAPRWLFAFALVLAAVHSATGYCAIARLLALLPCNRRSPLSWAAARHALLTPPTRGSILRELARDGETARA